jgi:hypothetical protein
MMASLPMLVAMAAVSPMAERRRRARAADQGLALLERLDVQARTGAATDPTLQQLAAWAQSMPAAEDAKIAALLRDVELRALVELAKRRKG